MHQVPRMSVYTRFRVLLPLESTSLLGLHRTQVDPRDTTLDKAAYNCPSENTGTSRYTPTVGSVWPCAFLIVIVKLRRTRNCFLLTLKGSDMSSDGDNRILRMKTLSPTCVPLTISASYICLLTTLKTKWVPLHKPLRGSRLRRRIRGQLIFILSSCGGRPFSVMELRNSWG
jgi:hypothetical protein